MSADSEPERLAETLIQELEDEFGKGSVQAFTDDLIEQFIAHYGFTPTVSQLLEFMCTGQRKTPH
jgi:hypothetical protein